MVGLQILGAIILGAMMAQASSVSIHNITFAHNFATEALNAATPYVNFSEFGYHGGQLPKVYALNQSSHGVDYLPEESFAEFRGIIAGTNNASAAFSAEQEALVGTSSSTTTTTKRTSCQGQPQDLPYWDPCPVALRCRLLNQRGVYHLLEERCLQRQQGQLQSSL